MSLRTKLHRLGTIRASRAGAAAEEATVSRAVKGRFARALKGRAGFTLTEALATVIIVGLVTSILASGIALASRQYVQSMSVSEAQMLYSSLQKILDTELRFTSSFEVDASGNVTSFESKHYIAKGTGGGGLQATSVLCTVPTGSSGTTANAPNTPGLLGMASGFGDDVVTNVFLGKGSYNYGLEASVPAFRFNENTGFFELTLAISKGSGEDRQVFAEGSFTVRALNAYHKPTTSPPSGEGSGTGEGETLTPGSWKEFDSTKYDPSGSELIKDANGDIRVFDKKNTKTLVFTGTNIPDGTELRLFLYTNANTATKGDPKYVAVVVFKNNVAEISLAQNGIPNKCPIGIRFDGDQKDYQIVVTEKNE